MASRITVTVPSRGGQPAPSRGLDRRSLQSGADTSSVWSAVNVDLTTSGGFRRRDGLLEHAELPPNTLGLYALAGKLHVAVPAGHGYQGSLPPDIQGDVFGDSDTGATEVDRYTRVSAQSSWGASSTLGALPYLVLKTSAGQYVHHWIDRQPLTAGAFVRTRVDTGFEPGPDLEKVEQKFYAPDRTVGVIRYSSTEFGPRFWSEVQAPDDAGFLAVNEHALSDPEIQGVTTHQGRLVVVFADSMQFWDVDPDPALFKLDFTLNGPGTRVFGSLAPVIGDVYYLSEGGFRSLATQTQTGELREGDIGASIRDLTAELAGVDNDNVIAIWSQARSQYLCFVNRDEPGTDGLCTVFAFTLSPTFSITGWTTWELPILVDYVTELNGVLYIRRGDMVYKFDAASETDDINGEETTITAYFETQFLDGDVPQFRKQWMTMDILADGTNTIRVLVDRKDRTLTEVVAQNLAGASHDGGSIPIDVGANAIAIRVELKSLGTVEQMTINAIVAAGSR